jgi:hypothetical protein
LTQTRAAQVESLQEKGADPETHRELEAAREVVGRIDVAEDVDPGDLGAAAAAYRRVYEHLLAERRSP